MAPYKELYPVGTKVRIASRAKLDDFLRTSKFHHPLAPEQLLDADRVVNVGSYHGGDVLYGLRDVAGTWHEECLASVDGQAHGPITASCARCRATFEVPAGLTSEQRAAINRLVQQGSALDAMRVLRETSGLPVRQVKAMVLHLTKPGAACHQCRSSVSETPPLRSNSQSRRCRSSEVSTNAAIEAQGSRSDSRVTRKANAASCRP